MDTRATRTRLSVIPVFIALLFNIVAPVLAMAVPAGGARRRWRRRWPSRPMRPDPRDLHPRGLSDSNGDFIEATFICAEPTTPPATSARNGTSSTACPHRLTTSKGNGDADTYTMGITADHMDAGHPGYDITVGPGAECCEVGRQLHDPRRERSRSSPPGSRRRGRVARAPADHHPGQGHDLRLRLVERLALGSLCFPGSSLHTNRTNQQFSTSGIGAADVSIPCQGDPAAGAVQGHDRRAGPGIHLDRSRSLPSPARLTS